MPLTLPDFANLDAAVVADYAALAAQQIGEDNPRLDAERGVLGDLVVRYHALLAAQFRAAADEYEKSRSLIDISADPAGTPDDAVDDVLGNFRVTRLPGELAEGEVTIVVSGNAPVLIAAGAIFDASGRRFVTTAVYTAKPEGMLLVAATDRRLRAVGANQFAFEVPVVAESEGSGFAVRRGALVVPTILPPGYVTSYATSDFTSGLNPETNEEMLQRLQEGLAAQTPSNRACLRAMLRNSTEFNRVVRTSAVGIGMPEMGRDRYWIFPISGGGRVDWYLRTTETVERQRLTVTATRVDTTAAGDAVLQFALGRDVFPGFYEITAVRPQSAADDTGSLEILAETRALDLTGTATVPDVQGLAHGAYSRYQTAVVQFADPRAEAPGPAESGDYVVEVTGLPLVGDIQDYLNEEERSGLLADLLIRAAVPAFVGVQLTVDRPAETTIDVTAVQSAVSAAVNAAPFVGRLYGSALLDAAYGVLPSDARVTGLDMLARLRYPDGRTVWLRGHDLLQVTDDPDACVTSRTVQWFSLPEDIAVSVVAVPNAAAG